MDVPLPHPRASGSRHDGLHRRRMTSLMRISLVLALARLCDMHSRTCSSADPLDAAAGKALFDRNWIPAPSSTNGSDGLGPLFTSRSCASCHARGEGARVVTREDGYEDLAGAVVRFGRADGSTDPFYGLELQTNAVPGLKPEGSAHFLPKLTILAGGSGTRQRRRSRRAAGDAAVWPGRIRARAGRRDSETRRSRRSRSRRHFGSRQPDGSRHRPIWLEGGASDARRSDRARLRVRHWTFEPEAAASLWGLHEPRNRMPCGGERGKPGIRRSRNIRIDVASRCKLSRNVAVSSHRVRSCQRRAFR